MMKKRVLSIAVSLALPGLAMAAPPVGFGTDGSADNGQWGIVVDADGKQQIDHVCPSGFDCGTAPVADENFLQIEMTEQGSGITYFRTIIATDNPGTESFSTESFVRSGANNNGGIAAAQSLNSNQGADGVLQSDTTLHTGSFNTGEEQVALSQEVWDSSTSPEFHAGFGFNKNSAGTQSTTTLSQEIVAPGATDGFSDSFNFVQVKNPSDGAVQSSSLDIVSGVVLNQTGGTLNDQTFRYSVRAGDAVALGGSADMVDNNGNNVNISWTAAEEVERVLVGQNVTDAGSFGYERIGNVTTPAEITRFDLASTGPFSAITNDPFGTPADPSLIAVPPAP